MSDSEKLTRRQVITAGAAGTAALGAFGLPGFVAARTTPDEPLEWLPAWRLRELIVQKHLSPVEVLEYFLRRIDSYDASLGAFVIVDGDRAMAAARAAEQAVMLKAPLGPLHGVPVSLKQMIAVAGLPLEGGDIAERDAITTSRIRGAGGIVIGTTSLAGPAAMLGDAQVGAANPWNTERVAGASSSGSAASVAAGLCPVSIGSDGGGSTRLPAAWCGLVGMHPTVGRVPADSNISRSLSRTSWSGTYGPITRDVRDAATVLSVIAGPHWYDLPSFNGAAPDYLKTLADGVQGLRLAWVPEFDSGNSCFQPGSDAVLDTVRNSAAVFSTLGAQLETIELQLGDWYPIFTRIAAQLSAGAMYPLLAGGVRAWDSLRGEPSAPHWSGDLDTALQARHAMAQALLASFEHYDILMSATSPVIAPRREDYAAWLAFENHAPEYTCLTGHMNLLGFPAITVPAGFVQGMPVGLQLIARPDDDATLLRVAQAFMQAQGEQPHAMGFISSAKA